MIVRRARRPTSCIGGLQWCDLRQGLAPQGSSRLLRCAYPSHPSPLLPLAGWGLAAWPPADQGSGQSSIQDPSAGPQSLTKSVAWRIKLRCKKSLFKL